MKVETSKIFWIFKKYSKGRLKMLNLKLGEKFIVNLL